jgi:hypothetical protein
VEQAMQIIELDAELEVLLDNALKPPTEFHLIFHRVASSRQVRPT